MNWTQVKIQLGIGPKDVDGMSVTYNLEMQVSPNPELKFVALYTPNTTETYSAFYSQEGYLESLEAVLEDGLEVALTSNDSLQRKIAKLLLEHKFTKEDK